MDKNQIISELYQCKDINGAIQKMEPVELQEDLKQEMFMVLCEMDDERLIDLHSKGFLKFFLVRTMLNMIKSDRSGFYKNFRNFFELGEKYEPIELKDISLPEVNLDQVFGTTRQGLYEKDMFLYYVYTFNKNAAQLSKATKIPYITVVRTIKNAKCKIKSYLKSLEQ